MPLVLPAAFHHRHELPARKKLVMPPMTSLYALWQVVHCPDLLSPRLSDAHITKASLFFVVKPRNSLVCLPRCYATKLLGLPAPHQECAFNRLLRLLLWIVESCGCCRCRRLCGYRRVFNSVYVHSCEINATAVTETKSHVARHLRVRLPASPPPPALDNQQLLAVERSKKIAQQS